MNKGTYQSIRRSLDLKRNELAIFKHFSLDLILIAACFALGAQTGQPWMKFCMIPLISILMFRNFGLMHEASHNLISKNRKWNSVVGTFSGGLCLLAYEPWRRTHLEHHYWSGNVEKDPVMALINIFPKFPQGLQKAINFSWQAWLPLLAVLQHVVFWAHSIRHALKDPKDMGIVSSLLLPIAAWGALLTLTPAGYNYLIFAPALILYLSAVEIVNLPHHLELPQLSGDHKFPIWEQHQTSRSCIYPLWLSKLVVLNFNYHIEHHLFPDAPWYQLPKIHTAVKQELQAAYNEDAQFAWTAKNRSRKLGDILTASKYQAPATPVVQEQDSIAV